jgi:hypothetical protein
MVDFGLKYPKKNNSSFCCFVCSLFNVLYGEKGHGLGE